MAADGFLQGFAFVDADSDNVLDFGEARKPGATIELRTSDGLTLLSTTTTNNDGYYRFDNLESGIYRLVEIAPPGFIAQGVQAQSILSGTAGATANSMQVSLVAPSDPAWTATPDPLTVHRRPGLPGVVSAFTLTGAPFNAFTSQPAPTTAHQYQLFLTGDALGSSPSADFYSFCVDLFHANPDVYAVDPSLVPAPPGVAANLGRIGYLYNEIGRNLLSPTEGTGMQLAMYELVYDTMSDLNSGNFVVNQSTTDPGAYAAANAFLAASVGKDERVVFLNVTPETPTGDLGRQGMIVADNFNFANALAGTITVVKDTVPNALQDFTFIPNFADAFLLDDDQGVVGGNNTRLNTAFFNNLAPGVYSITELAQAGFQLSSLVINDPDGGSSVDLVNRTATIDVDAGENITVTFTNLQNVIVVPPDKANRSLPFVHIVDADTGELFTRFLAYEQTYRGGVRVATGDINGDGVAEIITAPGRNRAPLVRIFNQSGVLLKQFFAFHSTFKGGVDVAVGDVNGDGMNDIAAAMSYAGSQVKLFQNTSSSYSYAALSFSASSGFYPFGSSFKGGAVLELADMGTPVTIGGTKQLDSCIFDGKAEIIVGNESGMRSTVKVFAFFAASPKPTLVRTFLPFSSTFRGGLSLDVDRVNADLVPDIIVGAGPRGNSQVEILDGKTAGIIVTFRAFRIGETTSYNAPVDVAALDEDGDGIAEFILAVQGCDGNTRQIRRFNALTGELVDTVFENDGDFAGAYFIATLKLRPQWSR